LARLLMIISSARSIDLASDKGHTTGYFADEVLKPYDKFVAAGVEVVVATVDGATPQIDPYGLKPWFHYPDEDKDFLSQITRSFAPDFDDIRITLHHLTELDLMAARRVFQALVASGLDRDTSWSMVTRAARKAWFDDKNFIEILSHDPEVTGPLDESGGYSPERLRVIADEARSDSEALSKNRADRLAAIEAIQHPLNLHTMSDDEILSYDVVFFPGGHGPMVDLSSHPDVARVLHLFHPRRKTIAAVCHGPAALLSAGTGPEGIWLFDGYKLTAFTEEEEDQTPYGKLGLPWYLENDLKKRGAVFDDGDAAWVSHVVVDRNLMTGQNPNSSEAIAEAILKKLEVAVK
jgi:putative intracellular protease/amidase